MKEHTQRQTELLEEILKWVRFSGIKQVKDVLLSELNSDKKIIAYHHSNGKNTSTVISKISGINQPKVSDLWREWTSLGLGESISASGGSRFRRTFDLKMFGIQVPESKQSEQKTSEVEPQNQNDGGAQT